ncbi:MAG: gamma-glutamyltransferase [Gammaproteobacteria bacterium]|nr:MAG: gamma-glutamyltransferase [Gammaproteobacteria bacterium]
MRNPFRSRSLPLLLTLLLFAACSRPSGEAQAPAAPPAATRSAAVAMPDAYSAAVSEDILRAGGNAVDAAIAGGFALAVTLPEAGNIGGGGFMLIHADGESVFLDYREVAPLAAQRDMYLDETGEVIPQLSFIGHLASGVPGTVAGFYAAHQRFGQLPWEELLAPAIRLAAEGFDVPAGLEREWRKYRDSFVGKTNFARHFGELLQGRRLQQPELAATLRRIANSGAEDFYAGETASLIVAEMARGGGLITAEDLRRYQPVWRDPLAVDWRGYRLLAAPPPSSGGFAVIQLLQMKDKLHHYFAGLQHNSPQYVHLIAEMEKRVFADRAEYLGDPDYLDLRIDELIADDYIAARARQVNPDGISALEDATPGLEPMHTTHFSIVDADGNAVSNSYTLNNSFGSGVVVSGAGFLLNNQMDDFSVKPGVPNYYGVVGSTANEIQPGKRMLSSMSPTLLLKDGQVAMVLGAMGGSTIFTTVFQVVVNLLDFGMTPDEAVNAARFHHQLLPPDLITYTPGRPLPAATVTALGDLGYRLQPHFFNFGNVQLIVRDGERWSAASESSHHGQSRVINLD